MTPTNFFYWLQGYFEILASNASADPFAPLTPEQMACIAAHVDPCVRPLARHYPSVCRKSRYWSKV